MDTGENTEGIAELLMRLKSLTDIVDLIREKTALTEDEGGYRGVCVFHHDVGTSLFVNPVASIYKCEVCRDSGDGLAFVQRAYRLSFTEAVLFLADRYEVPR